MPSATHPRSRSALRRSVPAIACVATIVAAVALLGSCSGERASLGSLPPKVPASSVSTTISSSSTIAPTPEDLSLGTEDLLGWIATPVGNPKVYAEPSTDATPLPIDAKTAAGAPTTFAIVGDASPSATTEFPDFYRVALPTRPNGSTGWVPKDSVTVTKTPFRIFVDLKGRTLRVEKDGSGVFTTEVAIGTKENPTPVNGTYVTELIANTKPNGAYGPYAFGLAMHSDTLSEFGTGDGQVGIHGTNQPELIGQAVSHGCIRLKNGDVKELVDLELPLGVPVFIT